MKARIIISMACALFAGCIGLPECASEHDETVIFRHKLVSDSRVSPILDLKPNHDIYVLADSRALIIFVNSPTVVTSEKPGHEIVGPGNQYTSAELAVIENVALDVRSNLGITRDILIYDDSTKREHKCRCYRPKSNTVPSP